MSPELVEAIRPFGLTGLAIIVLLLGFKRFRFGEIRLEGRDGLYVAMALIFSFLAVFVVSALRDESHPEESRNSWIQEGSKLSVLFEANARDAEREWLLRAQEQDKDKIYDLRVDQTLEARDDYSLAHLICQKHDRLICTDHETGSTSTVVIAFQD